ncbi:uncharacterized protein LOC125647974 [Ostrea edulis]|uniref:uncharacterized protein LOC125647974 n=1 Tax=Ostrea edulis TaxID=37623 RepID=UPI0020943E69|nr:uncharacterized protein LOC125647974 [Ostrea edulis]
MTMKKIWEIVLWCMCVCVAGECPLDWTEFCDGQTHVGCYFADTVDVAYQNAYSICAGMADPSTLVNPINQVEVDFVTNLTGNNNLWYDNGENPSKCYLIGGVNHTIIEVGCASLGRTVCDITSSNSSDLCYSLTTESTPPSTEITTASTATETSPQINTQVQTTESTPPSTEITTASTATETSPQINTQVQTTESTPPSTEITTASTATETSPQINTQVQTSSTSDPQTTTSQNNASQDNERNVTCLCTKVCHVSYTSDDLQTKVQNIKQNLTVDTSVLSATVRKLTCAEDTRPSSAVIGYTGGIILVLLVLMIISLDCFPKAHKFPHHKQV